MRSTRIKTNPLSDGHAKISACVCPLEPGDGTSFFFSPPLARATVKVAEHHFQLVQTQGPRCSSPRGRRNRLLSTGAIPPEEAVQRMLSSLHSALISPSFSVSCAPAATFQIMTSNTSHEIRPKFHAFRLFSNLLSHHLRDQTIGTKRAR